MLKANTIYNISGMSIIDPEGNTVKTFNYGNEFHEFLNQYPYKRITDTSFKIASPEEIKDKIYIGIEYIDNQYKKNKVITYSFKYNAYLVKEEDRMGYNIESPEEIKFYLSKQDKYIESMKRSKEREIEELKQLQDEENKKKELENVHGYCDNMTPMQKGKILKVLLKLIKYNDKVMTRKEFIHTALKENRKPIVEYDVKHWNRNGIVNKPIEYSIDFIEYTTPITKTEYNYAKYLIDNNIEL